MLKRFSLSHEFHLSRQLFENDSFSARDATVQNSNLPTDPIKHGRIRRFHSHLNLTRILMIFAATLLVLPRNIQAQQNTFILPPASNTGLPEGASFEGLNEAINLTNGNVFVSLPLLDLPGLAGFDFKLNLLIDSKIYSMTGGNPPTYIQSSGTYTYDPPGFDISRSLASPPFAGGRLSLPGLSWSTHDYSYYEDDPLHSGSGSYQSVACRENFVFTDMNGTMHGFNNRLPCQPYAIPSIPPNNHDDTYDGSLMRLDTSNPHDMVVYDKSGTQYHFDIDGTTQKITDPNGNAIIIARGGTFPDYTYAVKDSLNRTITITPTSISYLDSDGRPRQITSSTITDGSNRISMLFRAIISSDGNYWVGSDTPYLRGEPDSHSTLSMPTGETYTFYFDALRELTKIQYPSGGYTRYVFHNVPGLYSYSGWSIYGDVRELQQRAICAHTDGNCSSSEEAVTNYDASMTLGNVVSNANQSIDVRDPYSNRTHYEFSEANQFDEPTGAAPREVNRYLYSGETTLLRTIHTDYFIDQTYTTGQIRGCSQPKSITTTYNDISPTQQSRVEYEYLNIPILSDLNSPVDQICGVTAGLSSNVTAKREYDFDGSLIRTTTTHWLTASSLGTHLLDRKADQSIADAAGFTASEAWGYDAAGNLTSQTFGGTAMEDATTHFGRDAYGRLISSTDPLNNVTTYGYDSPWADTNCTSTSQPSLSPLPSSVSDALHHVSSTLYNSCTSTAQSTADVNNQKTTFQYDAIGRQTHIAYPPSGGELTVNYAPGAGTIVSRTRTLDLSRSATTNELHDGLGQVVALQNLAPKEGTATIERKYDQRGLVSSVSNAFYSHSDPTYGVTSYAYDALGRLRYACNPDNGTVDCGPGNSYKEQSYSGPFVEIYDESRNHQRKLTDALDRVIRIWEPNGTNSPTIETQYQYNALDELTSVLQLGQSSGSARTRDFQYGGRGQLIKSTNPENGTTCYGSFNSGNCISGYDANNRLTAKSDAQGTMTTYSYDVLNRLTSKTYTVAGTTAATLASCYQYDAGSSGLSNGNFVGRLTNEWTQTGACSPSLPGSGYQTLRSILAYDSMGRIKSEKQCHLQRCTTSAPHISKYDFDLAGNLTAYTNGIQSHAFTYAYDTAGRLQSLGSSAVDSIHPGMVFSGASYTAAGAQQNFTLGTQINVTREYDNRLRPTKEKAVQP